jgi:hypothetical protein
MWWHMLSRPEQLAKIVAADKAVDLLWFVHGLSFNLIGSRLFCDAVEKIKAAPGYKPCHRTTLSTSHLTARNAEANVFKIKRLRHQESLENRVALAESEKKESEKKGQAVKRQRDADTVQRPPNILFLIWGLRSTR